MRPAGAAFAAAAALVPMLAGCLHHNVVHNARSLYADAEELRRNGQDSLARTVYQDVVRKTGQALRSRPDGEWAEEARSLLGRSHLRLGAYRPATLLLEDLVTTASSPSLRLDAEAHLAMVAAETGHEDEALKRAERVLVDSASAPATAAAHLVKGRILASRGFMERAWWEFDRAVDAAPHLRVEVGLERMVASLRLADAPRARAAFEEVLANDRAAVRVDSVLTLLDHAAGRWGPAGAAELVDAVDNSAWAREPRSRVALARARLLDRAGEGGAALDAVRDVTSGLGSSAAEGRLMLARWRLADAADLSIVPELRSLLLPSASDPRVAEMLGAVDRLERLADLGLEEPLAWFSAGEVARDDLGARLIARGFFLAYVDQAPAAPWAPKAILAAIAVTSDEEDRAWLQGRLEGHADSPYVLAAHGGVAAGYEALEEGLGVRLTELGQR